MGQKRKQCQILFFWAPKSLWMVTGAMKLNDTYSLEGKLWYVKNQRHHFANQGLYSESYDFSRSLVWMRSVQFSSIAQSCTTLCDPMYHNTPGLPVHHQLPEFTQTHAHQVGDAIQPSHPLLSPSPPAPNPSQHQGLFQWVSSSHEMAKVLEFQPQHQSFQWRPRTDLL